MRLKQYEGKRETSATSNSLLKYESVIVEDSLPISAPIISPQLLELEESNSQTLIYSSGYGHDTFLNF